MAVASTRASDTEARWMRVLLVLAVLLCVVGQFNHDLWTPDEPRVAAIMAEMGQGSDYVVPHLAGEPFVEKPPLFFAAGAVLHRTLSGIAGDVGALRVLTALSALSTLVFVYLLGGLLYDREVARWAVVVLGTLTGFAFNSIWLRVDAGLVLFTTATIWALSVAYLRQRPLALIAAGTLASGTFLVKGPIGITLICLPWLVLFVHACRRREAGGRRWMVGAHAVCALCCLLPVGAWMVALRLHADGATLWHAWFWENQLGRFLGTAELGHLKGGEPLYYAGYLLGYLLPWLPWVVVRVWRELRDWRATHRVPPAVALVWSWAIGGLVVLSASSTKRDIYLLPLVPAFALMAAVTVREGRVRGMRPYAWLWLLSGLGTCVLSGASPLFASRLAGKLPGTIIGALSEPGPAKLGALLAAALLVWAAWRTRRARPELWVGLGGAAILWCGLTVAVPALDGEKSMGSEMHRFAATIPADRRPRVASFDFEETELALFSFYERWALPRIGDPAGVVAVLEGRDPNHDTVILNTAADAGGQPLWTFAESLPPFRLLSVGDPRRGHEGRKLYWIEGADRPARR